MGRQEALTTCGSAAVDGDVCQDFGDFIHARAAVQGACRVNPHLLEPSTCRQDAKG